MLIPLARYEKGDTMTASTLAASAAISGNPFKESDYFAYAEQSIERHWAYYIAPILGERRFDLTVDLAIGYGRNSEKLRHISERVIGVDINEECIAKCAERFKDIDNIELVKTDGTILPGVEDNSVDLMYSFDAMVHFQPEVVEAYVSEFARVLKPGGLGFIHHSNWTQALGGDFQAQPHWRNYMSTTMFAYFVHREGLKMLEQKVIGWDESIPDAKSDPNFVPDLDGISVFTKE